MNKPSFIPVIPESAPFSAEQRAYLNGFFAGLFSREAAPAIAPTDSATKAVQPLTILFGSQTGNAEKLAKRAAKEAVKRGYVPTVQDLGTYSSTLLSKERFLLVITSTFGDGEPPDNAKNFWNDLSKKSDRILHGASFSVCSLGDQNYPQFCAFGRALDQRLSALGARCAHPRQDCDVDFEQPFLAWLNGALTAMAGDSQREISERASLPGILADDLVEPSPRFTRDQPYAARLLCNRRLSTAGSAKDVRHFEIGLGESGITYEVGDALGVWPSNHPELVDEILAALGCDGEEAVPGRNGTEVPLRLALKNHYEITRIPRAFLEHVQRESGNAELGQLLAQPAGNELQQYLWGREIIDLLLGYPQVKFTAELFVRLLRKLPPRLYSIASSLKAHPAAVHLCVNSVRYDSWGRCRRGVASTFLADGIKGEMPLPIFVQENKSFRLPPDGTAMIMIGPGTGIAPFRAFLEERRTLGAKGRNWLFFGDQCSAVDYLYRDEIEAWHRDGLLTNLDLAWSRDQAEKIYVQHRLVERGREMFAWLQDGAALYVCGDAARMAKDVDAALRQIVSKQSGMNADQAASFIRQLEQEKRYLRDVY